MVSGQFCVLPAVPSMKDIDIHGVRSYMGHRNNGDVVAKGRCPFWELNSTIQPIASYFNVWGLFSLFPVSTNTCTDFSLIQNWLLPILIVFSTTVCNLTPLLSGGCEGKPKPCTGDDCAGVQHAYCDTQLGVCLCKPGYEPQYDKHQLLLCTVDGQTTSDDSGAQHKVGTSASIIPPVHQTTASEDKIQSRFYYPRKLSYISHFMRRSQYKILSEPEFRTIILSVSLVTVMVVTYLIHISELLYDPLKVCGTFCIVWSNVLYISYFRS